MNNKIKFLSAVLLSTMSAVSFADSKRVDHKDGSYEVYESSNNLNRGEFYTKDGAIIASKVWKNKILQESTVYDAEGEPYSTTTFKHGRRHHEVTYLKGKDKTEVTTRSFENIDIPEGQLVSVKIIDHKTNKENWIHFLER